MDFEKGALTADEYNALNEYINTSISMIPKWEEKPKGGEKKMHKVTPIKVEIILGKLDYLEKTIIIVKELKRQHPDITVTIKVQKH